MTLENIFFNFDCDHGALNQNLRSANKFVSSCLTLNQQTLV